MKERKSLWKRIGAVVLALAMVIGIIPVSSIAEGTESKLKIAVMSDVHYYPINYVTDCDDYTTYVNGDPKLLEESGGILDSAAEIVIQDEPDILLVSGDLTKDGEIEGHRQFRAKLDEIHKELPDTQIYVINGNHDINNSDAWTFEKGYKESVASAAPEDFCEIYSGYGYNADRKDTDTIEYYINSKEHPDGRVVGGLSYKVELNEDYVLLALDSGMYSIDSDNGYTDKNEHITGGRVDSHLLEWATRMVEEASAEGKTVIGLMHHGLLPHFTNEEGLLSEYVVEDWQETASALADAGLRYVFTGHMHANDVAEYTTVKGNHITDLETGSLAAYGSPVRSVTVTKDTLTNQETFDVSTKSVKQATYINAQGETHVIPDIVEYAMEKLYPETLLNNMLNGTVTPILEEIASQNNLKAYLQELMPDTDLDTTIVETVKSATANGMNLNLGAAGTAVIRNNSEGIEISVSGVAGPLVGTETITDQELIAVVDDVLAQVKTKYINDPSYLQQVMDELATEVSNIKLGVQMDDGKEATLYDLIAFVLINHYRGHESAPSWVKEAVEILKKGTIIQELIDELVPSLCEKVTPILENLYLNFDLAISGSLMKTTLNDQYANGQLKAILDGFGINLQEMINGLISEYMSESFRTGMGEILAEIVENFIYDNSTDDVVNGEHRILYYNGKMNSDPQEPSIENGMLPTEVSMTFGKQNDSAASRAFRWYTGKGVTGTVVRYSTSADMSNAVEVEGSSQLVTRPKTLINLGLLITYAAQQQMQHTASISNLAADTTYYYQVGAEGKWSDVASFHTYSETTQEFTAIGVSDSQGMTESDYRVFEKAYKKAQRVFADAEFTMNIGDMVDEGTNLDYWDYLTNNETWKSQVTIPVTGNHEVKAAVEGAGGAGLNPIEAQFNLNAFADRVSDETGVYYSFDYKNATFVVLNTNDGDEGISDAQYNWAKRVLNNSNQTWKIVLMHKSAYSNGPHCDDDDVLALRTKMNQLCEETEIDLVISGHDHVYNRTPILSNGKSSDADETKTVRYNGQKYTQSVNANGTVFVVIGTAGVKNYEQDLSCNVPSEVALQPDCPIFTGLTINENALYFDAYTYDSESDSAARADSFSLCKVTEDEQAYLAVIEKIDSLPTEVTLDDQAAVEEARAAYNELTAEDKEKVTNYQTLVEAETTIQKLTTIENGKKVTVTRQADFEAALKDPSVTYIEVNSKLKNEATYTINRDLKIGGTSELYQISFTVTNGARFVLADSIYVNGSRAWGSLYTAINPVTVEANSSVVLEDQARVRSDYGTGTSGVNGVGIYLKGDNSTAIINSTAQQWASEYAVRGVSSTSNIVINSGSFECKNHNSAVYTAGTITINGGDKIAGVEVASGATGYINGGSFTEGTSNTQYTPLVINGTVYMTAGTVTQSPTTGFAVELNGTLYMRPSSAEAISIAGYHPYISSIATTDYSNVSADLGAGSGISANTSYDKLYYSDRNATDFVTQTRLSATALSTTISDKTMMAEAPSGQTTYIFAKSDYYSSARAENGYIRGSGNAYLYNNTRVIENYAVTDVEIENGSEYVILQTGKDTTLNAIVKPDNAFNDAIEWTSSDEDQITIGKDTGVANSSKPGIATITATAAAYPTVRDTILAITMDVSELTGPTNVTTGVENNEYQMTLGEDLEGTGLHVRYSVDDTEKAVIDKETGMMSALRAGTVTVTATAYYQETELPVSKSVTVRISDIEVQLNSEPAEGGTVSKDKASYKDGDTAVLTAAEKEGYRFVEWKDAAGNVVSTDATYTTAELHVDTAYTAVFEKMYEVVIDANIAHGSVEVDKEQACEGEVVTIRSITPDEGWQLVSGSLKVTYQLVGEEAVTELIAQEGENAYTFIMPKANVTITAEFEKTPYNIEVVSGVNGSLSVSGMTGTNGKAVIGDEIVVNIVPEKGYLLKDGTLKYTDKNGAAHVIAANADGTYTFTMPSGNITVSAEFTENEKYKELQESIEAAENTDVSDMSTDTAEELKKVIESAKEVLDTVPFNNEKADEQIKALEDAIKNLKKNNLLIVPTEGGSITYKEAVYETEYKEYVNTGTEITLQANAKEGAEFLYWQDIDTSKIIGRDTTLNITMGTELHIRAVFMVTVEKQYQVTFLNYSGMVLKTETVAEGGSATAPEVPEVAGYDFGGWDKDFTNVTEDITVKAKIVKKDGWYDVTVTGGTVNGQETVTTDRRAYDSGVTVVADGALAGQKFAYWKLTGTDQIVSYSETFTFKLYEDVSIEAVYVDANETVEVKPVVWLASTAQVNGRRATVLLQRELPEGCQIVEWGIVRKKANVTDIDELQIGAADVKNMKVVTADAIRQRININFSGETAIDVTVRGYIIYKDAAGNVNYVYDDSMIHFTVE